MTDTTIVFDTIQKIEQVLQITIEPENLKRQQEHSYKSYNNRKIDCLTLSNLSSEKVDALVDALSSMSKVDWLVFINCSIKDVVSLFRLENVGQLTLDNVKVNDTYDPNRRVLDTLNWSFQLVKLKNMEIKHISFLLPISKNLSTLELEQCTIHNFYEMNLFPDLYSLSLIGVHTTDTGKEVIHKAKPSRRFIFLKLIDMQLDDLAFLLPIAQEIIAVELISCVINSMKGFYQFPKIERLDIDSTTKISSFEIPTDKVPTSFKLKKCFVHLETDSEGEVNLDTTAFDLKQLRSIAAYIKCLSFNQYGLKNIGDIKYFTQLDQLEFEQCNVNLDHFLPIAPQIKSIRFDSCFLKSASSFKYYTSLENIQTIYGYINAVETKVLKSLSSLLPIKHQLKKLRVWEDGVEDLELIKEFSELESLDLYGMPKSVVRHVFSLSKLKKLSIDIDFKKPCSFTLKKLKSIEWLDIGSNNEVTLKGFKHLKYLKRLDIGQGSCLVENLSKSEKLQHFECNSLIDINAVGLITSLKTLKFRVSNGYEIKSLEQFPNLKYLSVEGTNNINLGILENLKVLNMEGGSPDGLDFLKNLPNLKKLDLGNRELKEIPDLSTLTNLTTLNLSENYLENIEAIQHFKCLKYLNLCCNAITDIKVLNSLPKLKKVNLADNKADDKTLKKQLNKPEIATFLGVGRLPFVIWETKNFEL